jgi:predicted site-specific integrase-resolvase
MRIDWEECDPESGVITQVLGRSCRDHDETRTYVRRDLCQEGVERVYGEVRMKAALYCRVSTEEQAKSGYSLRQQMETLRRYCDAHDLEVVGEFEDRASGASLDRLGLDALRDAVSAGGVDVVLAQDRDRFSREPAHHYVLGEDLQWALRLRRRS